MTDNTREEEIVAQFELDFTINDYECNGQRYYPNLPPLEISNWLRTTFHQELQKAREEAEKQTVLTFSKNILEIMLVDQEGAMRILEQNAYEYLIHSELDQDKV